MNQTQTGLGIEYVWPSDITDYVNSLDPQFEATGKAAESCSGLSTLERASWATFYTSWQDFKKDAYVWFGVPSKLETIRIYEKQLKGWQDTIVSKGCSLQGPAIVVRPEPQSLVDNMKTILTWTLGAGAVVAGAYLLWPLLGAGLTTLAAQKVKKA